MKKTKIWLAAAAAVLMLCACGEELDSPVIIEDDPTPTPVQTTQPTNTVPETIPPNIVTEDDSQPPHAGMVRSRLTNEWIDSSVASTRPIAVMVPNESAAVPHYSHG